MVDASQIKEHAEVIGADGVHVGTVDHVQGDRIKLTKNDSPQTQDGQGASIIICRSAWSPRSRATRSACRRPHRNAVDQFEEAE